MISTQFKKQRLAIRKEHWPEVTDDMLCLNSGPKDKNFTSIPKGLSLITRIMDTLSQKRPLAGTYITLWCYAQDEMLVVIPRPRQMAMESGFTGQRAEYTWLLRMELLKKLGFIKAKASPYCPYQFVLLLNPYLVAKQLCEQFSSNSQLEMLHNTLIERIIEIGDTI